MYIELQECFSANEIQSLKFYVWGAQLKFLASVIKNSDTKNLSNERWKVYTSIISRHNAKMFGNIS